MQAGMKTDIWDMSFCYQKSNLFIICSLVQLPWADYRYDLTDISSTLLDTFRECGICLNDLEMKLKEESVVYEAESNESFSD